MIYTLPKLRFEIIRPGQPLEKWYAAQKVKPYLLCNASLYEGNRPIGTIIEGGKLAWCRDRGFHTSKTEVKKLKTAATRALCAESDARGVLTHLGLTWVPESTQGGSEEDENMVTATATKKQSVYTESGIVQLGRYIAKGDKCTLGPITEKLLIGVTYPTSSGTRAAYVKSLDEFRA